MKRNPYIGISPSKYTKEIGRRVVNVLKDLPEIDQDYSNENDYGVQKMYTTYSPWKDLAHGVRIEE